MQYGPASKPLPPEESRRLRGKRNRKDKLTAADFKVGERVVTEYRMRSGRIARQLVIILDVYDHESLCDWSGPNVYGVVIAVQEKDQKPLVDRIVRVSVSRDGFVFSREVRLRDDIDWL